MILFFRYRWPRDGDGDGDGAHCTGPEMKARIPVSQIRVRVFPACPVPRQVGTRIVRNAR